MRMFADGPRKCNVWRTDAGDVPHDHEPLPVRLQLTDDGEGAVVTSEPFETGGTYTIEARCEYGLFVEGNAAPAHLTFYSTAQGGGLSAYSNYDTHLSQLSLDLTVSVYHHHAVKAACGNPDADAVAAYEDSSRPPDVDECSLSTPASQLPAGRVCVLAVIRWKGSLAREPIRVWTYERAGESFLSEHALPPQANGVVAILLPDGNLRNYMKHDSQDAMFLRVMMDDATSGTTDDGATYAHKIHVATHAFLLPRMEVDHGVMECAKRSDRQLQASRAPLQWQDCGLQADLNVLHLDWYSHTPDPARADGSIRKHMRWRSSATWYIRNLTEVATVYQLDQAGSWVQTDSTTTNLCGTADETSNGAEQQPCGSQIMGLSTIAPGRAFVRDVTTPALPHGDTASTIQVVQHLFADSVFAGCATVQYHVDGESTWFKSSGSEYSSTRHAVCHLQPSSAQLFDETYDGYVVDSAVMYLTETDAGTSVEIEAQGLHGSRLHGHAVHIGGTAGIAQAVSNEFNPRAAAHGCVDQDGSRIDGYLGDLLVDESSGQGYFAVQNNLALTLHGPSSVMGRTLVIYETPDRCGESDGESDGHSARGAWASCTIGQDTSSTERDAQQNLIRSEYTRLAELANSSEPLAEGAAELKFRPKPTPKTQVRSTTFWIVHVLLAFIAGGSAGALLGKHHTEDRVHKHHQQHFGRTMAAKLALRQSLD